MLFSPPASDIWHVGIAGAPIADFLRPERLSSLRIDWLPVGKRFTFIADPFAVSAGDSLTVFVEAFDYRRKKGEIHYYRRQNASAAWQHGVALRTAHHLSYPFVIKEAGDIYLLPEAHHSGKLTLYRAAHFPDRWEPVADLLNLPAVDASILKHNETYWMFYALPGPNERAMRELHVAYAPALTGPWTPHPKNPVRTGRDASRPGGTPFVHDGQVILPMQDCRTRYGGAVQLLRTTTLTREDFACAEEAHIAPETLGIHGADGLHTLSACGDVTLLDINRIDRSYLRHMVNWQRRAARWRR